MYFRALLLFCACFSLTARPTLGQTTVSPGNDVSELKAMVTALQQQVSAIHNHLLTHQTLSIDAICKNFTHQAVSVPNDCYGVLQDGHNQSGIYTVQPPGQQGGIQVYCDQTTLGGGWLVYPAVSQLSRCTVSTRLKWADEV